jgi:F0F1-type ATP synthase epsilon subunit
LLQLNTIFIDDDLCLFVRFSPDLQDVVCPEAVKLDDLDPSAVTSNFEAAKSAFASATAGSVEQAEAQIDMEVNKAMGMAIGLNLA